jgi:hypothetical protein
VDFVRQWCAGAGYFFEVKISGTGLISLPHGYLEDTTRQRRRVIMNTVEQTSGETETNFEYTTMVDEWTVFLGDTLPRLAQAQFVTYFVDAHAKLFNEVMATKSIHWNPLHGSLTDYRKPTGGATGFLLTPAELADFWWTQTFSQVWEEFVQLNY